MLIRTSIAIPRWRHCLTRIIDRTPMLGSTIDYVTRLEISVFGYSIKNLSRVSYSYDGVTSVAYNVKTREQHYCDVFTAQIWLTKPRKVSK